MKNMEKEEDNDLGTETLKINELRESTNPEITKNICKIEFNKKNEKISGTGFFCKIPVRDDEKELPPLEPLPPGSERNSIKMPALITCFHILDHDFFQTNDSLSFSIFVNGIEKKENLMLKNNNRIIYKGDKEKEEKEEKEEKNKIDIVIIEIKEEDNLDIFSFLEIDNFFNFKDDNAINEVVYLLHCPEECKNVLISKGNTINKTQYDFYFSSNYSSNDGSSGGPVILKNKVIGVHSCVPKDEIFKTPHILFINKAIELFNDYMIKEKIIYKSPYSYLDTIEIIYDTSCIFYIRIFGTKFVKRYKNICKIIYKNTELPLKTHFWLSNEDKQSRYFKIKLKGVNYVTDMSEMFRFCKNLLELPDISRMDTSRVTNVDRMFEGCVKLEKLNFIYLWNMKNILSMIGMFYNCSNLKSLSEINKWNLIKLVNCLEIFYGCKSLPNSEVAKIENWPNMNESLKRDAFNGYQYGKKTNKFVHCMFDNPIATAKYWISSFNEILNNKFLFFGEKKINIGLSLLYKILN